MIGRSRILALIVGAAALAGQVSWSRIASATVGGTFASGALTLSGAMAGLAAGAALAGAALGRWNARALLRAALLCGAASLAATPWLLSQIGGPLALRRILAVALLAAAHVPFGAILPSAAAWRGAAGELYALVALGGAAGALGVGSIALDHTCLFLGIATASCTLLTFVPAAPAPTALPRDRRPIPRTLLAVAFGTGLLGLAAETLWLRILGFYWESSPSTFAIVTAATVGGLSLGSLAASRIASPGRNAVAVALALAAACLGGAASLAPAALQATSTFERAATALALVGLPAAFSGAAFVFLIARADGRSLGLLAGANSAGAAAGPLLLWAAAPLIPWAPPALLVAAAGTAALSGRKAGLLLAALLALAGAGLAPRSPSPSDYRPFVGPETAADFDASVFPFVRSTLESTVVVSRDTRSGVDVLWIDRSFQGDTSPLGRRLPALLGRLPCRLLDRCPRRAMVIGLGTGVTLSGILDGGAQAVDVAELSRGVIEANRTLLAEGNGRALERDEVRVHHADGRTILAEAPRPYDLIVTDMVFPSAAGAGTLFSREFYALARRRLAPDGLFVHWLPCSQLSPDDLSSVAAAFLESFPDASAWIGSIDPRRLILGLAGGRLPAALPPALLARRALGPAELRKIAAGAAPIRDADPRLEIRSRPRGDDRYGTEILRRLLAAGVPSPAWRRVAEAGLDPERALALCEEASRLAPGTTDAEFMLKNLAYERDLEAAALASSRRDAAGMMSSLRRAAAHPLYGMANLPLAEALASRGRLAEAMAELEKAVAKSPRSADAHMKLALLAFTVGDAARGRRAFEAASALRPDLPPLYREVARQIGRGGG